MGTLLPDWLARRAELAPAAPAIIAAGAALSFAQLDGLASLTAGRLRALGLAPGERVAALLRNGPLFAALAHAMPRCGGVMAPLNTRLAPAELAWQAADCGARLLVYDEAHAGAAPGVAAASPGLRAVSEAELAAMAAPPLAPEPIDLDALHTVIYTSGTTGRPKGATLSYGNHWWSATGSALNLGLRGDDRWLAVLPLFHVGGLSILMRGAIYGIPAVIHERFEAAAANRAIDEGVTIVSVVATMLQRMLEERGGRPYPAHLRCVLLGGGPAPRPLLEACAAAGVPVVQTYGMTETASQAATLAPADALRKLGSAGKALLPLELRVDGAPGAVGEIMVRGPMVTPGYLGQPEATAAALAGGWLHTGDLGYLDDEGYLYVVDRRSDLIISGGENVYPAEVEAVLLAHPAVAEAGVAGAADPTWGQVPVAFVVPRPGAEAAGLAEALIAFCRERLAGYKVPRRVSLADELPRTASGKLRRAALREATSPGARSGGTPTA